jgi:hypothetical protein
LFGFCIIHILNTGCAKIWKKVRRQKVNDSNRRITFQEKTLDCCLVNASFILLRDTESCAVLYLVIAAQ